MKQYDLTRGSVKGHFARYFVPTLLSNFSVSAFAFVAMFYVGKGVGADGLAAVSYTHLRESYFQYLIL